MFPAWPFILIAAGGQTWKNGAATNRSTTEISDGYARPGVDGVRRGGGRRGSRGPCCRNPVEAARGRHFRRGRGKGLRGRRPHHVGRRDRSVWPRCPAARLAW